jgi:hypothetical protein
MKPKDFEKLFQGWPAILTRREIERLSGGAVKAQRLSQLDMIGEGPPDRFRIGHKVCYPKDSVIQWLLERMQAS